MQKSLFNYTEYQGLRLQLAWDDLHVGSSFFIPCLDTETMLRTLYTEAERRGYKLTHEERIEAGMAGIRFWRIATDAAVPPPGEPS
jgi:hypothetical protein